MKPAAELFEAYLKCPTKCWLLSKGAIGEGNAYAEWVKAQNEAFRAVALRRLQETVPENERVIEPPRSDNLKAAQWRLAVDMEVSADNAVSRLDSVERVVPKGRGRAAQLIPIRVTFRNKLIRDDRLLVAFDAQVLSEVLGCDVDLGKIIHGNDHGSLRVHTAGLLGEVRKSTGKVAELVASGSAPDLVLNRHCGECEFRDRCRKKAVDNDDLSLLGGMTDGERRKLRSKGIFTVTQLSYTFRARRRPKKLKDKRDKYYHSLKALAIREKKLHIVGNPQLKIEGTPVYLDVEGMPDRDFYYLIGLRTANGDASVQYSLWADSVHQEMQIWRDFLGILSRIPSPILVHYGSYETTFLKRMCERYGHPPVGSAAANAINSAINVPSFLYARVYFPTHSNSLKDTASFLGFIWTDAGLSGPYSIICRSEWELLADAARRQRLIAYNADDCKALQVLTEFACGLRQCDPTGVPQSPDGIVFVDRLKPLPRFNLISKDGAALPEFTAINKAAYWDYQRDRVYVRSSKTIKRASKRARRHRGTRLPVKVGIEYPPSSCCPHCGGIDLDLRGRTNLLTYDVSFMRSGVRGFVRRQIWPRYYCARCQELVRPPGTRLFTIRKYGLYLRAYAIDQLLQLRISGIKVARAVNQILHIELTGSLVSQFKSEFAEMYGQTVGQLIAKITTGSLVHADETQARVVGKAGYVWVLSSLEEVVYVYTDTREGDMIQSMLGEFHGVLVSDFYAVYDSINCVQQKCLIHLMRDINDELHKHPFDLELKGIAQEFARLLRPMVETIDRHGLRKRFLSKHVAEVDKFYSRLSQGTLTSEVALGYEKRFVKYRSKLFSFLKHNDIPWNNNNAENAIRAFGELREIIKGVATEKGLREYLVLLSVCETCKRRGISFLEFLLSGEISIDTFAARKTSHLRGSVREGTREKGQQPRLPRGSSGGRRNATAGPGELSRHQRDDRNVPERDGERVIRTQKFGSPIEEKREPVVLRGGGPALNVRGACGECAGHDGESNSIKLEDIDRVRGHSIPTFTPHDERRSSAGASVLPDGRNPECTCSVNDRCLVRTQNGHRVVIASGVVLAQYAVGDHMAESYAMVNLVNQGLANQTDVARAFGCSTRTVRRHQRRFEDGGLAALARSPGPPGRARVAVSNRQLVQDLNLQGHSHREIARRVGVSEKTIRKLVRSR
jgi:predicted RecB family nuclease